MKANKITAAVLVASLAFVPTSLASAHEWHRGHGGGPLFGLFAAGAAVVGAAALIATAPVRVLADAASEPAPVYQAPPVYAAPVAYAPPVPVAYPAYGYAYSQPVVYSYPAGYYGRPRGYYAYAQ